MDGINPKNLNDKIRLKKCLKLRKFAPGIPDNKIKEIYDFLEKQGNKVILTTELLYFVNEKNEPVKACVVNPSTIGLQYEKIELSSYNYHVVPKSKGHYSSSGCSSCSGCSSNNNNNNNNNG